MKKKFAALLATILVLSLLAVSAMAADLYAPAKVIINASSEKTEELKAADTSFDVYKIATYTGTDYIFEKDFSTLSVDMTNPTDEAAEKLAQEALALIKEKDLTESIVASADMETAVLEEGLETGNLYLILAHGKELQWPEYFEEMTEKDADENEATKLVTIAKSGGKVYSFLPILVTLRDAETSIEPKYSVEDRYGALRLTKTLTTYDDIGPATFVISVTGYEKNPAEYPEAKQVFSDVAGFTFSSASQQTVTISKIPVGTYVKFEEVYTGSQYTPVKLPDPVEITEAVTDVEISDDTKLPETEAVNDHTEDEEHGHGITNTFKYGKDGWQWYKDGVLQTGNAQE